jgi:hypothetical protein
MPSLTGVPVLKCRCVGKATCEVLGAGNVDVGNVRSWPGARLELSDVDHGVLECGILEIWVLLLIYTWRDVRQLCLRECN